MRVMMQEKGFNGHNAYSVTKLANLMYSVELAPMMEPRGVTVNCVHPGVVSTHVLQDGWGGGGINVQVVCILLQRQQQCKLRTQGVILQVM